VPCPLQSTSTVSTFGRPEKTHLSFALYGTTLLMTTLSTKDRILSLPLHCFGLLFGRPARSNNKRAQHKFTERLNASRQKMVVLGTLLTTLALMGSGSAFANDWFETLKGEATDQQLHQFLYEMPKGGDLHHHMSGSGFSQWWYELALAAEKDGYRYFTKVKLNNCRDYGGQSFNTTPYHLMFQTIVEAKWQALPECEQNEYLSLDSLDEVQKQAWMDSIRLDKPFEGRDEFFETHWQRLGDLTANPYLRGELILKNFRAFSDEGLIYVEPQVTSLGYERPDGSSIDPYEVATILRARLAEPDFKALEMTYRFQLAILRFLPGAEDHLAYAYKFVAENDPYVAVNMVGREDNDKGYPLRFLPTLRALRHEYGNVRLSIHAGEVDEPNFHVRDTLLLGADRIGHGLNLITDPDTMRLMRHGPYMVEINLVSNLLLGYYDDYKNHPFPEYLRIGIPVALSTDDRGMWDSTMTDEFFVAVHEFNLSWDEIQQLSENSLKYAFLPEDEKSQLIETYRQRIARFERRFKKSGISALKATNAPKRAFICNRYEICAP
jgi:adenosine deaminase CECR1